MLKGIRFQTDKNDMRKLHSLGSGESPQMKTATVLFLTVFSIACSTPRERENSRSAEIIRGAVPLGLQIEKFPDDKWKETGIEFGAFIYFPDFTGLPKETAESHRKEIVRIGIRSGIQFVSNLFQIDPLVTPEWIDSIPVNGIMIKGRICSPSDESTLRAFAALNQLQLVGSNAQDLNEKCNKTKLLVEAPKTYSEFEKRLSWLSANPFKLQYKFNPANPLADLSLLNFGGWNKENPWIIISPKSAPNGKISEDFAIEEMDRDSWNAKASLDPFAVMASHSRESSALETSIPLLGITKGAFLIPGEDFFKYLDSNGPNPSLESLRNALSEFNESLKPYSINVDTRILEGLPEDTKEPPSWVRKVDKVAGRKIWVAAALAAMKIEKKRIKESNKDGVGLIFRIPYESLQKLANPTSYDGFIVK